MNRLKLEEMVTRLKAKTKTPDGIRRYHCSICRDRVVGCPSCRTVVHIDKALRDAGVPEEHVLAVDLPNDAPADQYQACQESVTELLEQGKSVLVVGANGVGKTSAVVRGVAAYMRGVEVMSVRFEMAGLLVRRLVACYHDSAIETVHSILLELGSADVLILDGLGEEKPTESVCADLVALLSLRRGKWTAITTNLPVVGVKVKRKFVDGILEKYGSSVASRLKGYKEIMVDGQDLREFYGNP